MAEEDQDQKTEQPTGKRLEEAREQGRIPVSREVAAWILFLAILAIVAWLAPPMAGRLVTTLRPFIEMPHEISLEDRSMQTVFLDVLEQVGLATAPIFALLALAAIIGFMAQTGLFVSTDLIKFDLTRLSPMAGIRRLFSLSALVELVKSFFKLIVFGFVVFMTLMPVMEQLPVFTGRALMDVMAFLQHQTVHLIIMLLLIFAVVAVADLIYQRYQHIKNLRMTKAEVKDEFRQQEGDPIIKSRLRQIRMEKARKRMMAQVPKADVVVTNPTHYAVAMQYDNKKMAAPVVLAKGINQVAQRIRAIAEENKIPLVSNPPLARTLYDTVEIDDEIPTQHYKAVAEIISYVYKLKKRKF